MKSGKYIAIALMAMLFSGCSYIGIGYSETYCQEHGKDYSDAGVCGNSYDIYKNIKKVKSEAYRKYEKVDTDEEMFR